MEPVPVGAVTDRDGAWVPDIAACSRWIIAPTVNPGYRQKLYLWERPLTAMNIEDSERLSRWIISSYRGLFVNCWLEPAAVEAFYANATGSMPGEAGIAYFLSNSRACSRQPSWCIRPLARPIASLTLSRSSSWRTANCR